MQQTFVLTDYECLRVVEAVHDMTILVHQAGKTHHANEIQIQAKPFMDQLSVYESQREGMKNEDRGTCSFTVPSKTVSALSWVIHEYLQFENAKTHLPAEKRQRRINALLNAHAKLVAAGH
jgi:hypothetical protein